LDKLSKPAAYYRRRAQAFKKILLDTASSLQDKKRFVAITARRLEVPQPPFVHPDVSGYICAPDLILAWMRDRQ